MKNEKEVGKDRLAHEERNNTEMRKKSFSSF